MDGIRYILLWAAPSSKIVPSHGGPGPHLYKTSGRSDLTKGCITAAHGWHSLHFTMGRPFLQNCPFSWGIWTPSNMWFPGSIRVLNLNGISTGLAFFAGLTSATDRPTDRPRYTHTPGMVYKTSEQSDLIKGCIAAAYKRFNRICQVVPMCNPSNTLANLTQYPNGISIGSAIFCTAHGNGQPSTRPGKGA